MKDLIKLPFGGCFTTVAAIVFSFTLAAQAANHYVRAGAAGNGSGTNWTNAYNSLPSTLVRGDTYYIATGAYPDHTFNDAVSGSSVITIKKATATDNGTAPDWSNSFDSGPATWSDGSGAWMVESGYYTFEGNEGSGTSGYGFVVSGTNNTDTDIGCIEIPNGVMPSNLTFSHIELAMPQWGNGIGIEGFYSNTLGGSNWTLQYCYVHGGREFMRFAGVGNVLIQHCYMTETGANSSALHCAGIVFSGGGGTIRYNRIGNMCGSSNTTYIEPQGGNSIYIYGNVFFATDSQESTSQGIFAITSTDTSSDIKIYNNTIYGLHSANPGVWSGNVSGSSVAVWNNAWVNCTSPGNLYGGVPANTISGTNLVSGGLVCVNAAAGDYHLTAHTAPGTAFSSPYNMDPDGTVRGSSGVWDIGAYQFSGTEAAPMAPQNLRITSNDTTL